METRKPMGVLEQLPVEQQAALEQWLFDDRPMLTYYRARERLAQEFQVKTSMNALSCFYHRRAQERMMKQVLVSAQGSRSVTEHFRENPSVAYDALMELIGQAAFDLRVAGEALSLEQIKDLATVAAVGLKARMDTKRVEIAEREAASKERQAVAKDREVTLKETIYRDQVAKKTLETGESRPANEATVQEVKLM